MSEWVTPVTDRNAYDIETMDRTSAEYQKGALNITDLNRIEGNFQYLVEKLKTDSFHIPRKYRSYAETDMERVAHEITTDYTVVEYIESSGTQYIDTGFAPNQDTRIILDFEISDDVTVETHICSARTSGSTPLLTFYFNAAGNYCTRYGTSVIQTFSTTGSGRHVFERNKNMATLDGVDTLSTDYSTFSVGSTLPLFCRNEGSELNNYMTGKIYSCQIYDNEELIRDFLPVKDALGIVCLYEKISGVYYYNAGTGDFIAGPEVILEMTYTYTYEEVTNIYTDWKEHHIPWISEINRIRANYNALVRLFLVGLGLPISSENNYLLYREVNDWETIAGKGKEMFEKMEMEYIPCGTMNSGGEGLL